MAFNNLEWEKFRNSFSDDATVFFPFHQAPRLRNGRYEVEDVFKSFFDELRKRKPSPPYQNIQPKDVQIQMLDKDAAILTFHLGGDDPVGRRTLVFRKQKGKWLIAHLHASVISKPK
ncbi:MAG: nuclear transport factor 2 family protein [Pyrinomonadaceae bacterium MAG19_C2-C3]|nr:nuclear transport factor 2 family protein [Pyrinomonadaceae bacterium MAG19_C2-C3]